MILRRELWNSAIRDSYLFFSTTAVNALAETLRSEGIRIFALLFSISVIVFQCVGSLGPQVLF